MATTTMYRVVGMTCGHCVSSVRHELEQVAGVTDVVVDLSTGEVVVTSDVPLDDAAVRAAVDEAGYAIAP